MLASFFPLYNIIKCNQSLLYVRVICINFSSNILQLVYCDLRKKKKNNDVYSLKAYLPQKYSKQKEIKKNERMNEKGNLLYQNSTNIGKKTIFSQSMSFESKKRCLQYANHSESIRPQWKKKYIKSARRIGFFAKASCLLSSIHSLNILCGERERERIRVASFLNTKPCSRF